MAPGSCCCSAHSGKRMGQSFGERGLERFVQFPAISRGAPVSRAYITIVL